MVIKCSGPTAPSMKEAEAEQIDAHGVRDVTEAAQHDPAFGKVTP